MTRFQRSHPLWYAFLLHRVSGLALAVFLPFHFYVLALAFTESGKFGQFIDWVDNPLVKLAETALVFFLAVHFFGGLRLLALELLPWSSGQKTYAAIAVAVAFFVACVFLLSAV
jgi:fumarate reductase subunit D